MSEVLERISPADKKAARSLEKQTGHGFRVHSSLQDLHEFFTRDEVEDPSFLIQPPIFKRGKISDRDLAKSRGVL